ncbi:hypothetical protein PHET_03566, partial [Paragonimus heterotremus]
QSQHNTTCESPSNFLELLVAQEKKSVRPLRFLREMNLAN